MPSILFPLPRCVVGDAPIDENQGIGFPVKLGKIHLLETRWAVVVVLTTMHPSSAR
jgi:hypothetical protein